MRKHFIIQLFIILCVIVGVWVYRQPSSTSSRPSFEFEMMDQQYDEIQATYEGKRLSDVLSEHTTENVEFLELLAAQKNHKPTLLVRFSDINCASCRSVDVPILKEISDEWDHLNLVFASSYSNEDDVHFFRRINDIDGEILSISTPFLPLDSTLINTNYYMLLDSSLHLQRFFIASAWHPDRTRSFFETLRE